MTSHRSAPALVLSAAFRFLVNPVVRSLLRGPAGSRLGRKLLLVRYRGRRTGRELELPVGYVRDADRLLVVVGAADAKTWWRNFATPQPVQLLVNRRPVRGVARLLPSDSPEAAAASAAVRRVRPRGPAPEGHPIVELREIPRLPQACAHETHDE